MNKDVLPIYHGKRMFLGKKDLVISFLTTKCQFECSFCPLPQQSSTDPISLTNILKQIHWVFDQHAEEVATFQQLSVGNEGSILDSGRFPGAAMDYLLERSAEMTSLEALSLETRPEYITRAALSYIRKRTHADILDVTIGFETQDETLRNQVLNKNIRRTLFEKKIKILGDLGARLTSYVLLKPGPEMTDQEGEDEAIATVEYLVEKCRQSGTELVIYLNPTYVAKGTPLAKEMLRRGYRPPSIQSTMQTLLRASDAGCPVYVGLWSENLADEQGDYTGLEGYDPRFRKAIKEFNRTQDQELLKAFRQGD